jgi:hypothetical protein
MTAWPADISPDFPPTPQTLWATWGSTPKIQHSWRDPVYFSWVLADAGEAGLKTIEEKHGELLAAIPFEQLSVICELLENTASPLVRHWPQWLPQSSLTALSLCNSEGGLQWKERPQATDQVLFTGHLEDLRQLRQEGQEILKGPDYQLVRCDLRPECPGKPADWLRVMKNPERAIPARTLMAQLEENGDL